MTFPRAFSAALLATTLAVLAFFTVSPAARAQAPDPKLENHPAAIVVKNYLNLVLQREWSKSAALIEKKSLEGLFMDYIRRVKAAPTMDDEEEMLRRVGKDKLEELERMTPLDFYVAYHQGIQERWQVSPEAIKRVKETLSIRVLAVGEEDENLAHVLVRTKHSNDKVNISNLEMISLVKENGQWRVGLAEQAPKITPLDAAAPAKPAETPKPQPAANPPAKTTPKKR